jgi:hypothetical protein
MNYQVVFDVAESGYKGWTFPALGMIFVVIGLFVVVFRNRLPTRGPKWAARTFPFVFLGVAVLWVAATLSSTYGEYLRFRGALREQTAAVVEGKVERFAPMAQSGHALESFCVKDACFRYSDYLVTSAFNKPSSKGGPISEGLQVRVTYLGNAILRLEVAR